MPSQMNVTFHNASWLRTCSLCILFVCMMATALPAFAQPAEDASVRIEHEVKLKVPLEQIEDVWQWLNDRYSDTTWLDRNGRAFSTTFGDEDFIDLYFDTPELTLLKQKSGTRHRTRYVNSGPATAKHGRELLQIKLNRQDITGLARSEIKFKVVYDAGVNSKQDLHPHSVLGLVDPADRPELRTQFDKLDINVDRVRPILILNQNRRRVYVNDQDGAIATLTLDLCSTQSWGTDLRWGEMEMELNEIRYTEADTAGRAMMEAISEQMRNDLLKAFPQIKQDQTPKYNTSFEAINASTWLSLPWLIRHDLYPSDITVIILLLTILSVGLGIIIWRYRARRHRLANGHADGRAIGGRHMPGFGKLPGPFASQIK